MTGVGRCGVCDSREDIFDTFLSLLTPLNPLSDWDGADCCKGSFCCVRSLLCESLQARDT